MTGVVVAAQPALAETPETWTDHDPMPLAQVLGIFVGLPVLAFAVITLLVVAPRMGSAGSRPARLWEGEPEWFGRPSGAGEVPGPSEVSTSGAAGETGGTSGRW